MDKTLHEDLQFCLDRAAMAQRAADQATAKGNLEDASEWLEHVDGWNDLIGTLLADIKKGAAK